MELPCPQKKKHDPDLKEDKSTHPPDIIIYGLQDISSPGILVTEYRNTGLMDFI